MAADHLIGLIDDEREEEYEFFLEPEDEWDFFAFEYDSFPEPEYEWERVLHPPAFEDEFD